MDILTHACGVRVCVPSSSSIRFFLLCVYAFSSSQCIRPQGDALAAEYVLLHSLSRVHARPDPVVLGCVSLSLRGPPPGSAAAAASPASLVAASLASALRSLLPRLVCAPLSVASLNAGGWVAHKDYALNEVVPGLLQLADGTTLLLDETGLQPGRLSETGSASLAALRSLATTASCPLDFGYYELTTHTDVPVLTVSSGASILPCSVAVHLRCDRAPCRSGLLDAAEADGGGGAAAVLARVREYLASARFGRHAISPSAEAHVEASIAAVRARAAAASGVAGGALKAEDLHTLLTLSRLMSLSHGREELTIECWERVAAMEAARVARGAAA